MSLLYPYRIRAWAIIAQKVKGIYLKSQPWVNWVDIRLGIWVRPGMHLSWKLSSHKTYQHLQPAKLRGSYFHLFYPLWCWSEHEAPPAGAADMLLTDPFSGGGGTPHFPSDSSGSKTCTPPSVIPSANWFGSDGCAAITSGYTAELEDKWRGISPSKLQLKHVEPK